MHVVVVWLIKALVVRVRSLSVEETNHQLVLLVYENNKRVKGRTDFAPSLVWIKI